MEIRIQANRVQKVSVRSKYDDEKLELTTTLQADVQLHPSDIARITNLLMQKVPLYLTIGSLQAQFDLQMMRVEPQREPAEEKPAPAQPIEELTRVVMLEEDAVLHTHEDGSNDFLSLHYSGLYLGPFAEVCPPVDQLKKGTMLKLYLDCPGGAVIRVELAEPKDIADQYLVGQMRDERDRLLDAEREGTQAAEPETNGSKPKRRGRKAKRSAIGMGLNTGGDESP